MSQNNYTRSCNCKNKYIHINNVWHFFGIFIYFKKPLLGSFKLNFQKFQQLREKHAKYTCCCVFVIVTQWLEKQLYFHKLRLQLSTISTSISTNFPFSAKPFANYFVSNISSR